MAGGGRPGGAAGPFGRSNVLVTRFLAVPEFEALYETALEELRAELFESGTASSILERRAEVLAGAAGLIDGATLEDEAGSLRSLIERSASGG